MSISMQLVRARHMCIANAERALSIVLALSTSFSRTTQTPLLRKLCVKSCSWGGSHSHPADTK